ncbi:hypothetical protein TcCL_Unassigned06497 [Trypanosoma cruzi]|nr:hypothetical protein TcCL_Unassigned06497 [Trypanosoma cruzi]
MLSTEEIATITLKSPFVHEYGDTPYFRRCINEFSLQFFVRYRTSRDDPSQHRWSRLLEVVDRHTHGTDAASTSTATKVTPLQWKEKLFLLHCVWKGRRSVWSSLDSPASCRRWRK